MQPFRAMRLRSVAKDPYFANVSVLIHCDGANGGTTFTDSGPLGLTCTAVGATTTSTAQFRAGTASAFNNYTTSTANRISVSNSTGLQFGSGDFTIELSVWWVGAQHATQPSPGWFTKGGASGQYEYFSWAQNGNIYFYWSTNGTALAEQHVAFTPSTGQWYDFAISRVGTSLYFYVNGTQSGATQTMNATVNATSNVATIFCDTQFAESFNGYIDEIRVTKGVGRYSGAAYTPTFPFPNS